MLLFQNCTSIGSFHSCDSTVFLVLRMRLHSSTKTLLSSHTALNLSWLKKPTELLRQYQVSRAVNGTLYGCKLKRPSYKRKKSNLSTWRMPVDNFTSHLIFAISQVFCSSFWHHLQRFKLRQLISDQDQERANSLQLLPSSRCVTRSPLIQEVLQQQRSGQLTGVSPYGRRAGTDWKEKHSYQCQLSHQGARAEQKRHVGNCPG